MSPIEGIGLFADEFIPAGTVTWAYAPGLDGLYTEADLACMTPISRAQFLKYAYHDKALDRYVLCFDDQRFINHDGTNPNIHSTPSQDVAARDIQPGEELTCDYRAYDVDWFERHGIDERSFGSPKRE
ncbi:MAG: SET domain-containing protein [Panacagrimonas sp.]